LSLKVPLEIIEHVEAGGPVVRLWRRRRRLGNGQAGREGRWTTSLDMLDDLDLDGASADLMGPETIALEELDLAKFIGSNESLSLLEDVVDEARTLASNLTSNADGMAAYSHAYDVDVLADDEDGDDDGEIDHDDLLHVKLDARVDGETKFIGSNESLSLLEDVVDEARTLASNLSTCSMISISTVPAQT
jgi:hypothetical protein